MLKLFRAKTFLKDYTYHIHSHAGAMGASNNLGELYMDETEQYTKAFKYLKEALDLREKTLYAGHERFAESYDNLAIIHLKREEYQKAKIEQDKAIEIWSYNHDDTYSYLVDARERLVLIGKELQGE